MAVSIYTCIFVKVSYLNVYPNLSQLIPVDLSQLKSSIHNNSITSQNNGNKLESAKYKVRNRLTSGVLGQLMFQVLTIINSSATSNGLMPPCINSLFAWIHQASWCGAIIGDDSIK